MTNSVKEKKNSFLVSNGDVEYLVQRCDFEMFPLDKVIVNKKTDFQEVIIADTPNYGRVLFLDGDLQSSEYDESLYHEHLVQPAMLFHKNPEKILVVGTGEGATLREIFKHKTASHVVAIDLDREVVDLCDQYLPTWHDGKMRDSRVEHVFQDGFEYLRQTSETFDLAIIDIVSDLDDGPAQDLYTPEFYQLVKSRLNNDGIVAIQGLIISSIENEMKGHLRLRNSVSQVFRYTHSYKCAIPSFLSTWGFLLASDFVDKSSLGSEYIEKRIEETGVGDTLKHLDGPSLNAAFQHSKVVAQLLRPASV